MNRMNRVSSNLSLKACCGLVGTRDRPLRLSASPKSTATLRFHPSRHRYIKGKKGPLTVNSAIFFAIRPKPWSNNQHGAEQIFASKTIQLVFLTNSVHYLSVLCTLQIKRPLNVQLVALCRLSLSQVGEYWRFFIPDVVTVTAQEI